MARLRLRAELVISTLAVLCLVLGAILVIVRQMLRSELSTQLEQSTVASLQAFETFQRQHAAELARTANLLTELPTLKALMTTDDRPTVQDASEPFWKLEGSDLFVLANPQGKVLSFHMMASPGASTDTYERSLSESLKLGKESAWWFSEHRLYLIFVRAITGGAGNEQKELGTLLVGFQINSAFASQLALVAGSQVAIAARDEVVASSFPPQEEVDLTKLMHKGGVGGSSATTELTLHNLEYEVASRSLGQTGPMPITCYVLKPMEETNRFLRRLNRIILGLGISAVLLAAIFLSFISRTITRPLDNLVAGVRALASGDYSYSVTPRGSAEVAELGAAFSKMRTELFQSQQRQIANERIAALGRAASSISHDLRHYLAAVVANAEFLYEADRLKIDRDEIYGEIKAGSDQMIDLLDSLRELAREDKTISPIAASLDQTIRRGVEAVLALPEFRGHQVAFEIRGQMEGTFDPKKIERVFFNLTLNAFQSTLSHGDGAIKVEIVSSADSFDVRVRDNGCGVPSTIQTTLFDPFVSVGKSNSTGLGLAIVKKIIHDHGGSIVLEKTSDAGTTFLVRLPRVPRAVPEQFPENIAS